MVELEENCNHVANSKEPLLWVRNTYGRKEKCTRFTCTASACQVLTGWSNLRYIHHKTMSHDSWYSLQVLYHVSCIHVPNCLISGGYNRPFFYYQIPNSTWDGVIQKMHTWKISKFERIVEPAVVIGVVKITSSKKCPSGVISGLSPPNGPASPKLGRLQTCMRRWVRTGPRIHAMLKDCRSRAEGSQDQNVSHPTRIKNKFRFSTNHILRLLIRNYTSASPRNMSSISSATSNQSSCIGKQSRAQYLEKGALMWC